MTEMLRSWILGIAGAAMLTAVCMAVTPDGRVKKVVALVCGTAVMLMLIKPVIGFDYTSFSRSYARMRLEAGEFFGELEERDENLTGLIIEEACSAYILDKGTGLGIRDLAVWISAEQGGDGYWYPSAARLKTDADKELRDRLGYVIQAELGIPPEEMIWSMNHYEE